MDSWLLRIVAMCCCLSPALACGPPERAAGGVGPPEVLRVAGSEAVVAWTTATPLSGRVLYRTAGFRSLGEERWRVAEDPFGASREHEVLLGGLPRGALIQYQIEGSEDRWELRSEPDPSQAVALLLAWGDLGPALAARLAEPVELLLALHAPPAGGADPYAAARPFLPVWGPSGPLGRAHAAAAPAAAGWSLDWGGLRLVWLREAARLEELLEGAAPRHSRLIVAAPPPEGPPAAALRAALAQLAQSHPELSPHVVLLPGRAGEGQDEGGVRWQPLPLPGAAGSWRLELGAELALARPGDGGPELTLRAGPVGQRRTCEECRRLADAGDHERALAAYREFLEQHPPEHFQVDDALFAVAEILDRRLHRYAEALRAYDDLARRAPTSALLPLAQQRAAYLRAHGDHDFEPLRLLERLRQGSWAPAPGSAGASVGPVEALRAGLRSFPDASVNPSLRFWLVGRLRASDPDAAVVELRTLARLHPDSPEGRDAPIEEGAIYYDAGRFREAAQAWQAALQARPERAAEIAPNLARARRNERRRSYAALALGLSSIFLLGAALLRPRRLRWPGLGGAAAGGLSLALGLGGGAWLLREQFAPGGERWWLVLGFALAGSLPAPVARVLALKLLGPAASARARAALGVGLGLALCAALAYLTVFWVNEHYLIVLGL